MEALASLKFRFMSRVPHLCHRSALRAMLKKVVGFQGDLLYGQRDLKLSWLGKTMAVTIEEKFKISRWWLWTSFPEFPLWDTHRPPVSLLPRVLGSLLAPALWCSLWLKGKTELVSSSSSPWVIGLAHGTYFTESTLALCEIATPVWAGFSL